MRTLPLNASRHDRSHDYQAECDYCGSVYLRSRLHKTLAGLLRCGWCGNNGGLEVPELAKANAEVPPPKSLRLNADRQNLHDWGVPSTFPAGWPLDPVVYQVGATEYDADVAWWRGGATELTAGDFSTWVDSEGGLTLATTAGAPTIESIDALGGFAVPRLVTFDELRVAPHVVGALDYLHDGSGGSLVMAFRIRNFVNDGVFRIGTYDGQNGIELFLTRLNPPELAVYSLGEQIGFLQLTRQPSWMGLCVLMAGFSRERGLELSLIDCGSLAEKVTGPLSGVPAANTRADLPLRVTATTSGVTGCDVDLCELAVLQGDLPHSVRAGHGWYMRSKFVRSTLPV